MSIRQITLVNIKPKFDKAHSFMQKSYLLLGKTIPASIFSDLTFKDPLKTNNKQTNLCSPFKNINPPAIDLPIIHKLPKIQQREQPGLFCIHLFNHPLNFPTQLLLHKSNTYPLQLLHKPSETQSKMFSFPCQISVENHSNNTQENMCPDVEVPMMINWPNRNKKYIIQQLEIKHPTTILKPFI